MKIKFFSVDVFFVFTLLFNILIYLNLCTFLLERILYMMYILFSVGEKAIRRLKSVGRLISANSLFVPSNHKSVSHKPIKDEVLLRNKESPGVIEVGKFEFGVSFMNMSSRVGVRRECWIPEHFEKN